MKKFLLCLILYILVGALSVITAQTINGSISGNVLDQQGAVVPGAVVSVVNTETGAQRTATTNDEGRYTISGLPVGVYNIKIESTGFAAATRENVQVSVAVNTEINFDLSAGQVAAQVDVTATGELIDTTQSQV